MPIPDLDATQLLHAKDVLDANDVLGATEAMTLTWTALASLMAGSLADLVDTFRRRPAVWTRAIYTLGFVLLAGHIALAFHWVHDWSHAEAYAATARQTEDIFGFDWGGGIWFNYAFTGLWCFDTLWAWRRPQQRQEARKLRLAWRWFFAFMAINATLVFGQGAARLGGVLVAGFCLAPALLRRSKTHSSS